MKNTLREIIMVAIKLR